jgi:activator of HSP90 ATPase
MTKIIHQRVRFDASPAELFNLYLDPKKHAAVIGGKVKISRRAGSPFSVFDGGLTGHTLLIVPNRMIVQSWRADTWKNSDADSILILQFSEAGHGGQIELIQVNVPTHTYKLIHEGWTKHYWTAWKAYLRKMASR